MDNQSIGSVNNGSDQALALAAFKKQARNARAKSARQAREWSYKSCGLVKVRGAVSGKVYWE